MLLIPLGAGNSQLVYRVVYDKNESPNHYGNGVESWLSRCVLKVPKFVHASGVKVRMNYHDELSKFISNSSLSRRAGCTPPRKACLLDANVAYMLRNHFYKLLDIDEASSCKSKPGKRFSECKPSVRKRIYHNKDVAKKTAIKVNLHAITIMGSCGAKNDCSFEPCILERDVFDLWHLRNSTLGALRECKGSIYDVGGLSLELKLKCGLMHFKGFPSVFRMMQPYKSKILYQPILFGAVKNDPKMAESMYEPCRLFQLDIDSVVQELQNMVNVPQNNIRVFIDDNEVSPDVLKNNLKISNVVAAVMLKHKDVMQRILKLQAFAAGQQFIAYALHKFTELLKRNLPLKIPRSSVKCDDINSGTGSRINKLMTHLDEHMTPLMSRDGLQSSVQLQELFYHRGRRILSRLAVFANYCFKIPNKIGANKSQSRWFKRLHEPGGVVEASLGRLVSLEIDKHNFDDIKAGGVYLVTFDNLPNHKRQLKLLKVDEKVKRWLHLTIQRAEWWLELYMAGRTAMDVSIILNILDDVLIKSTGLYNSNYTIAANMGPDIETRLVDGKGSDVQVGESDSTDDDNGNDNETLVRPTYSTRDDVGSFDSFQGVSNICEPLEIAASPVGTRWTFKNVHSVSCLNVIDLDLKPMDRITRWRDDIKFLLSSYLLRLGMPSPF